MDFHEYIMKATSAFLSTRRKTAEELNNFGLGSKTKLRLLDSSGNKYWAEVHESDKLMHRWQCIIYSSSSTSICARDLLFNDKRMDSRTNKHIPLLQYLDNELDETILEEEI
jgi:hypothetical protein